MNAIQELKTRAEILHRRMQADNPTAQIQRADCLNLIAKELGFATWTAAKSAISGDGPVEDFGTLLYPRTGGALNAWYRTYDEAHEAHTSSGGYLLAYRRQFFVVDVAHLETLGLDPADPDWKAMGFDWVRPRDFAARARLYAKLVERLPRVS